MGTKLNDFVLLTVGDCGHSKRQIQRDNLESLHVESPAHTLERNRQLIPKTRNCHVSQSYALMAEMIRYRSVCEYIRFRETAAVSIFVDPTSVADVSMIVYGIPEQKRNKD